MTWGFGVAIVGDADSVMEFDIDARDLDEREVDRTRGALGSDEARRRRAGDGAVQETEATG